MSEPAYRRKVTDFKVYRVFERLRRNVFNLCYYNFGYTEAMASRLFSWYKDKDWNNLTDGEKEYYEKLLMQDKAFREWYIPSEREAVCGMIRVIQRHIYTANSLTPDIPEEAVMRRQEQDLAIGYLANLEQELQEIQDTIPTSKGRYKEPMDLIFELTGLIRRWRLSDKKRAKR